MSAQPIIPHRHLTGTITISGDDLRALAAEELGWQQRLVAAGLRPESVMRYAARAKGGRFWRRCLKPEVDRMYVDLRRMWDGWNS